MYCFLQCDVVAPHAESWRLIIFLHRLHLSTLHRDFCFPVGLTQGVVTQWAHFRGVSPPLCARSAHVAWSPFLLCRENTHFVNRDHTRSPTRLLFFFSNFWLEHHWDQIGDGRPKTTKNGQTRDHFLGGRPISGRLNPFLVEFCFQFFSTGVSCGGTFSDSAEFGGPEDRKCHQTTENALFASNTCLPKRGYADRLCTCFATVSHIFSTKIEHGCTFGTDSFPNCHGFWTRL